MNYKALMLQLFLLVSFQAHGMLLKDHDEILKSDFKFNINKQLLDACNTEKPDLKKIEAILKIPSANINHLSFDNTFGRISPLRAAVINKNPELIQLLLNYKTNVTCDEWLLSFALLKNSNIELIIKCFTLLCNAGTKDNGDAFNLAIRLARLNSMYYQTIPLFKRTGTDSNKTGLYKETPLHILLDPRYSSIPKKKILITLMRDYNANPYLQDIHNRTVYDLAKQLDNIRQTSYYWLVSKYDRGLEWYSNNPKGYYKQVA